jgi:hypothetical protein
VVTTRVSPFAAIASGNSAAETDSGKINTARPARTSCEIVFTGISFVKVEMVDVVSAGVSVE